ncbi:MAG TPA: TIR domain-containing protein [Candidatus Angelobacter sp.]|nr:TIR domain-containing protein [Candidatus Angelobacter sp.]
MSIDVFISYKRDDADLCAAVAEAVRGLRLAVFIDRNLPGGVKWQAELERILKSDVKPAVLVLATSAAENSEYIADEIQQAKEADLVIIPLEFDHGSAQRLKLGDYNIIHVDGGRQTPLSSNTIYELRRALHEKLKLRLEELRSKARDWAHRKLEHSNHIDFWEDHWSGYFEWPATGKCSVALIAPGGRGKSVLIAHFVHELLGNDKIYPIVFDKENEESLHGGIASVSELVSAGSADTFGRHVTDIERIFGERLIFIVDGLDTMRSPDDPEQKRLAKTLNEMAKAGSLVVGCRDAVWELSFAQHVTIPLREVSELDETSVDRLCHGHLLLSPANRLSLLQVPLFLDLALQQSRNWPRPPRSVTEFLRFTWDGVLAMPKRATPGINNAKEVLTRLANLQLKQMSFEVSRLDLEKACKAAQPFAPAINHLKVAGILDETPRRQTSMVRLRHDILDNFGMVQLLLDPKEGKERRAELYRRAGEDCGWSLLASLTQTADDEDAPELKEEVFSHLVDMLDRKAFGDAAMGRAWSATYVLRDCLTKFLHLILKCLDGEIMASLDPKSALDSNRYASSSRPPQVTQEAASSLASAFLALDYGDSKDAPDVIPVLDRGLYRWKFRRRFVDALAKYRDPASAAALEKFGWQELEKKTDLAILPDIAKALGSLGFETSRPLLEKMLELFKENPASGPRVIRIVMENLNRLLPLTQQNAIPPREESEIISGLKPFDENGRYTDWQIVMDNAEYVRRQILLGSTFSPAVTAALIGALRHDQLFVRKPVAECLAYIDDLSVRMALLSELMQEFVPLELRHAYLDALREHLLRLPATTQHCRRCMYLIAAREAERRHFAIASEIMAIVQDHESSALPCWLMLGEAAEVVNPPGPKSVSAIFKVVGEETAPIAPEALALISNANLSSVGPAREKKYRMTAFKRTNGGDLCIEVTETNWSIGAGFHRALLTLDPAKATNARESWIEPLLCQTMHLPGLIAVHVIVLTSDRKVLLAQRSSKVFYAPGHWSASFEEQISEKDMLENQDTAANAARRGFAEEFGLSTPPQPQAVQTISVLAELNTLNLSIVVLLQPGITYHLIRQAWKSEPRPVDHHEAQELAAIDASVETLKTAAEVGLSSMPAPLHPSSRLRLAMLARWMEMTSKN